MRQQSDQGRSGGGAAARFDGSDERWSPSRWTGELGAAALKAIDAENGTVEQGRRPAHVNGYVMAGTFNRTSDERVRETVRQLTDFAPFVDDGPTNVVARLSYLKNEPDEADIMGLAVKFVLGSGEPSDLIAMSAEVFPVATTRDFIKLLEVTTGLDERRNRLLVAPRLAELVITRRASLRALLLTKKAMRIRCGNGLGTTFHGVQTYRLLRGGRDGEKNPWNMSTPMRFRWVPDELNPGMPYRQFMTELDRGLSHSAIFHLELIVRPRTTVLTPRARNRLDDPRYPWRHDQVLRIGSMTLENRVESPGPVLGFNPTVTARGIAPGDNDLFSGRQGAYTLSFNRRTRPSNT